MTRGRKRRPRAGEPRELGPRAGHGKDGGSRVLRKGRVGLLVSATLGAIEKPADRRAVARRFSRLPATVDVAASRSWRGRVLGTCKSPSGRISVGRRPRANRCRCLPLLRRRKEVVASRWRRDRPHHLV